MDESIQNHKPEVVAEFLLTEYRMLAQERAQEIERGQAYVSTFLTISTGIAALLALMSQIVSRQGTFYFISIVILILILLLGLVSFVRVIQRDLRLTSNSRGMNRIKHYFVEVEPRIELYLTYPPYDDIPKYTYKGVIGRIGLRSIVALINSSALAALAFLATSVVLGIYDFSWTIVAVAVVLFGASLFLHGLVAVSHCRLAERSAEIRFPSLHERRGND